MNTYLRRRNPVIKLTALVVIVASLTVVFDPYTPMAFLVLALTAAWGLGGLSPRSVFLTLSPFLLTAVGILLANVLFNQLNATSEALLYVGPLKVTEPALVTAASLSFRMLCFAAFSIVFVKTTDTTELILSLVHQLRLHYRLAFGAMIGYRMLPLLQSDYETIRAAHRVRGVAEREGRLAVIGRLKRYSVPLLAGAVRRAERVASAMDARGFGAFPDRTYRRRMRVTTGDWLFLAIVVTVVAGMLCLLTWAGFTRYSLS